MLWGPGEGSSEGVCLPQAPRPSGGPLPHRRWLLALSRTALFPGGAVPYSQGTPRPPPGYPHSSSLPSQHLHVWRVLLTQCGPLGIWVRVAGAFWEAQSRVVLVPTHPACVDKLHGGGACSHTPAAPTCPAGSAETLSKCTYYLLSSNAHFLAWQCHLPNACTVVSLVAQLPGAGRLGHSRKLGLGGAWDPSCDIARQMCDCWDRELLGEMFACTKGFCSPWKDERAQVRP